MRRKDSIREFLSERWLYGRVLIFLLFLIYVFNLPAFLALITLPDGEVGRDLQIEKAFTQEVVLFIEEELAKVGDDYTPHTYFKISRAVEERKIRFKEKNGFRYPGVGIDTHMLDFQRKFMDISATEDFKKESGQYDKWTKKNKVGLYAESYPNLDCVWEDISKPFGLLSMFINLLLRGMLVSALLYILRMAEEGDLARVHRKKLIFFLAIVAWPCFLFKYPYNIVREIRIEAELRRIGKVFRQFTAEEKLKIRKIANSLEYKEWIVDFHSTHKLSIERSLFVAMIPALILYFSQPALALLQDYENMNLRDGPSISFCVKADPVFFEQNLAQTDLDWGNRFAEILEELHFGVTLTCVMLFFADRLFHLDDFIDEIDHVPLLGC